MAFDIPSFNFGGGMNPDLLRKLQGQYGPQRMQQGAMGTVGQFQNPYGGMIQPATPPTPPPMQKFDTGADYQNFGQVNKFGGSVGTQNPGNVDMNQVAGNVQGAFNRAGGGGNFVGQPQYNQPQQPQQSQPQAPVQKKQPGVDPYETWKAQGRPGGSFNAWMAQR